MKVLLVKMSSLGDVVHVLPAVTDLNRSIPGVEVDWVVEEAFEDIPKLHAGVRRVIPVAIRRWRKSWLAHRKEVASFRRELKRNYYDVVIDAQGLIKSAIVARMARGRVHGMDDSSAREAIAAMFYHRRYAVTRSKHAVERMRALFAGVFNYNVVELGLDYGLQELLGQKAVGPETVLHKTKNQQILFLHGTTWASKHWPEQYWIDLAIRIEKAGYQVVLAHGNDREFQRAARIGASVADARILPAGSLSQLIREIKSCSGVVAVDTGLGHLAGALNVPMISVYGATDPALTGVQGDRQELIVSDTLPCIPCLKRECKFSKPIECSKVFPPCFEDVTADKVFSRLLVMMNK